MMPINTVYMVDSFDSWLIVTVEGLIRAITGKLIVFIVTRAHVYACFFQNLINIKKSLHTCVKNYQNYQNPQPHINKILFLIKKTRLIVCLKISKTLNQLSTETSFVKAA